MRRFTRSEAVDICKRRYVIVGQRYRESCYYFDGVCELHDYPLCKACDDYAPCNAMTNIIRRYILEKPNWCREHWDKLCKIDKELFIAIWDFNGVR